MNPANARSYLKNIQTSIVTPEFYQFIWSLLMIAGVILVNRLLVRVVNRRVEDTTRRHLFRKIVNYVTTSVIIVGLLVLWIRNVAFLSTMLGFIAAGLAIALRDVIMSFFGWFKIIWSRPFTIGDRIQVQKHEGDIIDITPLHTVLLEVGNWIQAKQSTGRIVFIPNNIIFLESVYNSTMGFPYLWDEFATAVTFESDVEKAKELMQEPVEDVVGTNFRRARRKIQQLGDHYAISYENLGARVYTSIEDHGVKLTIRYLTNVRGRREVKSRLSNEILSRLAENPDVELAYPTYRVFRRGEGSDDGEPPEDHSESIPPDEAGDSVPPDVSQ
ncbi:MAG: mechanosensitive ion channel family protein [bacterium]